MIDLIDGYCKRFVYSSGKFNSVYMKNICKYIYEATREEAKEEDGVCKNYYEMIDGKSVNVSEKAKMNIKNICEKARIAFEADMNGHSLLDPNPYQALREAIEESKAVKLPTAEPYLTFLIYYLQKINSQKSGDFMPLMIYKPKVSFERMRLQQGFFIVQPFKKFIENNSDKRIRLVQEVEHSKVIRINNPELILRQLDYIGVNRGAMYGDFDNIARYINNKNKFSYPRSAPATGLDFAIAAGLDAGGKSTSQEIIKRAEEIIVEKQCCGNDGHCVLALIDEKGYPTASTISVSRADGIKQMTFCTGFGSNKALRVKGCNSASVCFSSAEYNITLVGTIEIVTDPEVKKEMWYNGLEHHFTGSDDPNYCVLRFATKRYNIFVDWEDEVAGTL